MPLGAVLRPGSDAGPVRIAGAREVEPGVLAERRQCVGVGPFAMVRAGVRRVDRAEDEARLDAVVRAERAVAPGRLPREHVVEDASGMRCLRFSRQHALHPEVAVSLQDQVQVARVDGQALGRPDVPVGPRQGFDVRG